MNFNSYKELLSKKSIATLTAAISHNGQGGPYRLVTPYYSVTYSDEKKAVKQFISLLPDVNTVRIIALTVPFERAYNRFKDKFQKIGVTDEKTLIEKASGVLLSQNGVIFAIYKDIWKKWDS